MHMLPVSQPQVQGGLLPPSQSLSASSKVRRQSMPSIASIPENVSIALLAVEIKLHHVCAGHVGFGGLVLFVVSGIPYRAWDVYPANRWRLPYTHTNTHEKGN